jgi:dTDP-4-amino-4,6-dideoxygalactose transaminase
MYISPWPGIRAADLLHSQTGRDLPYPLNARNRHAFHVARSGIYHLFRALRFQPGETVLVPDYHSGNEIFAIRAAGVPLVYYPIRRNLEPDLDALSRLAASKNARAIYVIHYLGWPQPLEEIIALCRRHGSILIEDCALSLLSGVGGRPLGAFGDYSIFCLYKSLPVPNGGLLVQNGDPLPGLRELQTARPPRAAVAGRSAELLGEALRSRCNAAGAALLGLKRALGRALRSSGVPTVPVGDIGWNPAHVHIGVSPLTGAILKRLDYGAIRRRRRENFLLLQQRLAGRAELLRADLPAGVCPLSFPILVREKSRLAAALRQRGIGAIELWNYGDPEAEAGGRSDASYLRRHVLELPVHQGVTASQIEYMAGQALHLNLQGPA